jgi:thymidylate kinase
MIVNIGRLSLAKVGIMLIMLDGVNGVGKSSYAYAIKKSFGINVCRAFRSSDKALHWGSTGKELQEKLASLKVPINTHVDDLFMADFMLTFQVDAVLDRTLASAIAYGRAYSKMDGWYKKKGNARQLLDFWTSLIMKCKHPLMYVWLDVEYDVAKERCSDRAWFPKSVEYKKLRKEYNSIFNRISFQKMRVQTDHVDVESGVERILRTVVECQRLKI